MKRILNDYSYPKTLRDDLVLWIFHANKIPPHIGVSKGQFFFSLKSNGKDDGIALSSVFEVIKRKNIPTLSYTLSCTTELSDLKSCYDRYSFTVSNEITCLNPIKDLLGFPNAKKLRDLLNELKMQSLILEERGYYLPVDFTEISDYSVQDIHRRLILLEAEKLNVSIRPMVPSDVDQVLLWENNPSDWESAINDSPYSRQDIVNLVEQLQSFRDAKQARWIIEWNGEQVGTVDVFNVSFEQQSGEVGILIDEKYRGNGLAKIALSLLEIQHELNEINSLIARVFLENNKSMQLFSSLDYEKIGTEKMKNIKKGMYIEAQLFKKWLKK